MENSLAIVVYNPKSAGNNPSSPLPAPESQNREPDNSMAIVVYEKRSEEGSSSTPGTQKKRKERVKALLKNFEPFSPEELPPGLNPGSTYYKGTSIGLPKGWVIEQRPRSNRTADQFFLAPKTGKQFRSLIEVRKFLENHTTGDEPETEEIAWDEIIRRIKRRKGPKPLQQWRPEPPVEPFDFSNPPNSVSWLLQDAQNNLWIPEVASPVQSKEQWARVFNSLTSNHNSQATGWGNGEDDNNGGMDFNSS